MTASRPSPPFSSEEMAVALARIADQIRALSNAGLHFTDDPYQIERYHTLLSLAAELAALVDARPGAAIERIFHQDLTYVTPHTVVDVAVFDDRGRVLLIRRADSGFWAMPGGMCEVNISPAENALREVWEETGCVAELEAFLGIFDSRAELDAGLFAHLYHLLFAARYVSGVPQVTQETLDVAWFPPDQIPWDALHRSHGIRLAHALAWRADPSTPPYFDRADWSPEASWQHNPTPPEEQHGD